MTSARFIAGILVAFLPTTVFGQEPTGSTEVNAAVISSIEQAPASQQRVSLEELVGEALAKNPAIQSAARRVGALRARVPQAKSLPDPTVSVGWNGKIVPFDIRPDFPPSSRNISAQQKIPFPGKLKLRGQIADREAEAAWWDYENIRRRVTTQVKVAYYDYFFFHKATEITLKNKELLEKLAQIARVRYEVGKGIQQDALRAEVELSRIVQRLTMLEQQEKTAQARLNTLLFRDPLAPLASPTPFEQAELTYTLETLNQLAREHDPGLQREQRLIERSQFAVNLSHKEYYPDFSVGYAYQHRPALPETQGFTVSVNIPIFYKSKQREGVREATQQLISAQRSRENRETTLYFEVKEQYLAAKASDELARLFSRAIVPQSSLALESSMAAYEVGKVDFLTMVDNFITVLDFEVNYYRELTNYQIALARLEPLVGVELTK
jgi:outer membrane protein TolC